MDFFLQDVLWGVAAWRVALATLFVFLGMALRRLITYVFRRFLSGYAETTQAAWDDEITTLLPAPLSVMAKVGLWYAAARVLQIPNDPVPLGDVVLQGFEIAFWVGVVWLLFRVVDLMMSAAARFASTTDSKLDDQAIPILRRSIKIVVGTLATIMVIQGLGYSVTGIIASLGVGGLALALAAQDTVANLFGSVIIFTDRPFQIGDWVEFKGIEGTVQQVGFRTSVIRRFDRSTVMVPNAVFSTEPVVNHSRRDRRRIKMTIGVTYSSSREQMGQLLDGLRQLLKDHEPIDQSFHFAHFVAFGPSSLDVQIYCFTTTIDWVEWLEAREQLMLKIMALVESLGLEFAYPSQTVYLRQEEWEADDG